MRPVLWCSGRNTINLNAVSWVTQQDDGNLDVYVQGGAARPGMISREHASSFLSALNAAAQPASAALRLDDALARLNALRHDMGTVGGNALVEIVRDIVLQLTEGR